MDYEPNKYTQGFIEQDRRRRLEENVFIENCFAHDIDPLAKRRASDKGPLSDEQIKYLDTEVAALRKRLQQYAPIIAWGDPPISGEIALEVNEDPQSRGFGPR